MKRKRDEPKNAGAARAVEGDGDGKPAKVRQRPFRRMKKFLLSPEELTRELRLLYLHHMSFYESLAALARKAGIPFESLRRFRGDEHEKQQLSPVNEEKLARALGHDAAFFRRLVGRFLRSQRRRKRPGPMMQREKAAVTALAAVA